MPKESTVPLIADGRKFRFIVMVTAKGEPEPCYRCKGEGTVDDGDSLSLWPNHVTCPSCRGNKTRTNMMVWDDDLEEHLRTCMDDYLRRKYCGPTSNAN